MPDREAKREYDRARRQRLSKVLVKKAQEYRARDPERWKRYKKSWEFKKKYGITLEEYEVLFEKQGRICAICRKSVPGKKGFHLDHDHKTKKVRGVLCGNCNVGLGCFFDDPEIMAKAIEYVRRHASSDHE